MKKMFFNIVLILIVLLLYGCENVNVVSLQLTNKEFIVVRGEVKAGAQFDGVSITRTLPVNEAYDTTKAKLDSVIVYVKINGVQIVPLHYYQNGLYKPLGNVYVAPGDVYELFAEANNTNIYSITKVPQMPVVVSASLSNNYITANVRSNSSEVYGAEWAIVNPFTQNVIAEASDFLSIVNQSQESLSPTLAVSTMEMPDSYTSDSYKNYRYVKLYAFDAPYQKYFNTKKNNQPISNTFVQGGDQIVWNVQGNNVIGLFIGVASGGFVKAN